MPYQVPQFIREEPKLMGLINFKQLSIVVGLGAFLFLTYYIFSSALWFWFILASIVASLGIAIAFGKLQGIPLYQLVGYIFRHLWLPKQYIWHKKYVIPSYLRKRERFTQTSSPAPEQSSVISKQTRKKTLDPQTLQQIADILDKQ